MGVSDGGPDCCVKSKSESSPQANSRLVGMGSRLVEPISVDKKRRWMNNPWLFAGVAIMFIALFIVLSTA